MHQRTCPINPFNGCVYHHWRNHGVEGLRNLLRGKRVEIYQEVAQQGKGRPARQLQTQGRNATKGHDEQGMSCHPRQYRGRVLPKAEYRGKHKARNAHRDEERNHARQGNCQEDRLSLRTGSMP